MQGRQGRQGLSRAAPGTIGLQEPTGLLWAGREVTMPAVPEGSTTRPRICSSPTGAPGQTLEVSEWRFLKVSSLSAGRKGRGTRRQEDPPELLSGSGNGTQGQVLQWEASGQPRDHGREQWAVVAVKARCFQRGRCCEIRGGGCEAYTWELYAEFTRDLKLV